MSPKDKATTVTAAAIKELEEQTAAAVAEPELSLYCTPPEPSLMAIKESEMSLMADTEPDLETGQVLIYTRDPELPLMAINEPEVSLMATREPELSLMAGMEPELSLVAPRATTNGPEAAVKAVHETENNIRNQMPS